MHTRLKARGHPTTEQFYPEYEEIYPSSEVEIGAPGRRSKPRNLDIFFEYEGLTLRGGGRWEDEFIADSLSDKEER